MASRADYDAAAYQTAHAILGRLSADDALCYLGRASVAALPYRPSWSELVVSAGLLAGQDAVDPPAEMAGSEAPF